MTLAKGITLMGRKQAEALMESTCVITRVTGTSVNSSTGAETPTTTSSIYSGKCRLRMPSASPQDAGAAGQAIVSQTPTLSLPVTGSDAVRVGDRVTVTTPLDSATVTGRISGLHSETHATARRFQIELVA